MARRLPRTAASTAPLGGGPLGESHRLADARSRLGATALASAALRAAEAGREAAMLKCAELERQLTKAKKQLELETSRRRVLGHAAAAGRRLSGGADDGSAPARSGEGSPRPGRGSLRDAAVAGARRLAVHSILLKDELWAAEQAAAQAAQAAERTASGLVARAFALAAVAAVWRARARRAVGRSARAQATFAAELRQVGSLLRAQAERQRAQLKETQQARERATPAEALLRAERAERRAEAAERALAEARSAATLSGTSRISAADLACAADRAGAANCAGALEAEAAPWRLEGKGEAGATAAALTAVSGARRRAVVLRSLPRALWRWRAAITALALDAAHAELGRRARAAARGSAAAARVAATARGGSGAAAGGAASSPRAVCSSSPRTAAAALRPGRGGGGRGGSQGGGRSGGGSPPQQRPQAAAGVESLGDRASCGVVGARSAGADAQAILTPAAVPLVPPLPANASDETRRLWAVQQRLTAHLSALLATAADASAQVADKATASVGRPSLGLEGRSSLGDGTSLRPPSLSATVAVGGRPSLASTVANPRSQRDGQSARQSLSGAQSLSPPTPSRRAQAPLPRSAAGRAPGSPAGGVPPPLPALALPLPGRDFAFGRAARS